MIRREKSEFMQVMEEENGISKLVDAIMDLAVDNEHSEKLAENFFEELDDKFKLPTVAYAIFIIIAQTYDMLEAQDKASALFFKRLMKDCVGSLGDEDD